MTQILYNLRTSDLGYRVTKFTDGEVESSYLTSDQACDCPAGHRTSCRHRQMLPEMLARHLADSDLFWDFDRRFSCDINGNAKRETVPAGPHVEDDTYGISPFISMGGLEEARADIERMKQKIIAREAAGQHTAAEGLPPEETVQPITIEQLDLLQFGKVLHSKPWRRL